MQISVRFAKEKETAGAVRYQECQTDGSPMDKAFAQIGTLYVRKQTLGQGNQPAHLWMELRDTEAHALTPEAPKAKK